MRTPAKFWGFSTKIDRNLDKKLLKFDIMNKTAIKSYCKGWFTNDVIGGGVFKL